jgi:hypothetical protein
LHKAGEKVTQTVGRGKITPTEEGKMMNILASRAKIIVLDPFLPSGSLTGLEPAMRFAPSDRESG